MTRKHIALNEDQQKPFREAKLALQQEYEDPGIGDNEAVALLAEKYLEEVDDGDV